MIRLWHSSCSAATLLHPEARSNAVRVGIGLYGLYPSVQAKRVLNLKPVLSWYTRLIQIKMIPAGTKIGYDSTYTTKRVTRLGIIPVGYYDGFDRRFSNRGIVLVQGRKCSVLGRICMNVTMIDLTDVQGPLKTGDTVVLIGQSKKESITADQLAEMSGTIHYEVVNRINPLLPRIVR